MSHEDTLLIVSAIHAVAASVWGVFVMLGCGIAIRTITRGPK